MGPVKTIKTETMKPKTSNLLISLTVISIFTVAVNSCKKEKKTATDENVNDKRYLAIEAVKKEFGNVGRSYVYSVNKNAKTMYYRNSAGQLTEIIKYANRIGAADCTHDCSNTSDPNDLVTHYTLQYIQRNFECGSATLSSLYAKWLISVPYTPLLTDPTNSSNHSYGVIKMHPFGGSPTTSGNITDMTIRSIGADPNCGSNNLYEITYKFNLSDNLIFGDFAEASLNLYNDCRLVGNLQATGFVTGNPIPNDPDETTYLSPCERVDKVWVNPGTGSSDASALGSYSICSSFPSGFIATTYQQVQWRLVTNGSSYHWDDQTSTVQALPSGGGTPYLFSASAGFATLTGMHSGNGTWLVRYRNREPSYGCGNHADVWTIYVTEIWPL